MRRLAALGLLLLAGCGHRQSPAGAHGLRLLRVRVRRDGSWASDSFPVWVRRRDHELEASTGLWGAGLHLPA